MEIVAEDALDAVAALGLGGAAFLCAALEGLEEGAVREGLPRETARARSRIRPRWPPLCFCAITPGLPPT